MRCLVRSIGVSIALATASVACGPDADGPDAPALVPRDPATADLALLVEAFRPLVADPAWSVRSRPLSAAALKVRARLLSAQRREKRAEGYEEGLVLDAVASDGARRSATVSLFVARFDTDARAATFVADEREILGLGQAEAVEGGKALEESVYGEGVGESGRIAGFTFRVRVSEHDGGERVEVHIGRIGPIAFVLALLDAPWLDRSAIDAAVARFDSALSDPAAARNARTPPAVPVPDAIRKKTPALAPGGKRDAASPERDPPGGGPSEVPAPDREVTVHVLAPDGSPVRSFQALIRDESTSTRPSTFEDGLAVLSSPGGTGKTTVRVWGCCEASGVSSLWAPAEHVLSDDEKEITIRLERGFEISGQVLRPDGSAAGDIQVIATAFDDFDEMEHGRVNVGTKGRFRIVGLARRAYRLTTADFEHRVVSKPVTVTAGRVDVVIRLVEPVNATVTVVDEAGKPVAGAVLHLLTPVGPSSWTSAERPAATAAGTIFLSGLTPGVEYRIEVRPPPSRGDLARHDESDWLPRDATITLAGKLTIHGSVRDLEGRRVPGAKVVALREDQSSVSVTADPRGHFRIRDLPFVRYRVSASFGGVSGPWIAVDPSMPVELELVVPAR